MDEKGAPVHTVPLLDIAIVDFALDVVTPPAIQSFAAGFHTTVRPDTSKRSVLLFENADANNPVHDVPSLLVAIVCAPLPPINARLFPVCMVFTFVIKCADVPSAASPVILDAVVVVLGGAMLAVVIAAGVDGTTGVHVVPWSLDIDSEHVFPSPPTIIRLLNVAIVLIDFSGRVGRVDAIDEKRKGREVGVMMAGDHKCFPFNDHITAARVELYTC